MSLRNTLIEKTILANVLLTTKLTEMRKRLVTLYDDWVNISLDGLTWQRQHILLKYSEDAEGWYPMFLDDTSPDLEEQVAFIQSVFQASRIDGLAGAAEVVNEYCFDE
jgi:hypothetical protein